MANFDPVARPYALLERAVFRGALQRARLAHIGLLDKIEPGKFLLTGEGDGRFAAHLAKRHPTSEFTLIDSSARMLDRARQRLRGIPGTPRVQLVETDILAPGARVGKPPRYHAVISHFFLDCFTGSEVTTIAEKISRRLRPDGFWIVTDFQDPNRLHQKFLLRIMYRFFRHAADLRVQNLPGYPSVLGSQNFHPVAEASFLRGFVKSTAFQRIL